MFPTTRFYLSESYSKSLNRISQVIFPYLLATSATHSHHFAVELDKRTYRPILASTSLLQSPFRPSAPAFLVGEQSVRPRTYRKLHKKMTTAYRSHSYPGGESWRRGAIFTGLSGSISHHFRVDGAGDTVMQLMVELRQSIF